jgi:gliotoxin/aspirochlorine/mycotoxins biosynthesis cytochrome P450 monooxygenase
MHVEDHTPLPTCRYQWPNGQGDSAKFLEGGQNSDIWGKQFGSLYRIWSGMTPEVYAHLSFHWCSSCKVASKHVMLTTIRLDSVLTRPEHIQAVFRDSDKHHKAVDNNSGYLMSQILGQCVGLVSGEQWRNVRTVAEKAFTRGVSTSYINLIEERTQNFFADLQKSKNLAQGLLDPAEDLKLLPFLVVAEIVYGRLSPEMEQQLRKIAPRREALFKHVIRGGLARFNFSQYLPTAANQALSQFKSDWHAFNQMAFQRAISENIDAPIVAMFSAADTGTISYEQLYQTLDEMLYANLDVTIGGISWNVVFLAANAEVQAQIRAEVAEARERADNQGGRLDQYLLSSSSLLAACVLESARLRPLAAFSVPQSAPTPRMVAGYVMPAGTNFLVDSYALNHPQMLVRCERKSKEDRKE